MKRYEDNPVIIPILVGAVILAAGGVAAAAVIKKKRLPVALPVPGVPVALPVTRKPKQDPAEQVRILQEKYGQQINPLATAAAQQIKALVQPSSASPPPAGTPAAPTPETEDVTNGEFDEGNIEDAASDPKDPMGKATGALATAQTGASILGVGLGTIALAAGAVAIVAVGVSSLKSHQKKMRKTRKEKKLYLAAAIEYAAQLHRFEANTAKLKTENKKIRQGIARLKLALSGSM